MPGLSPDLPRTRDEAKQRAKALRQDLFARGVKITYSQALERVAAELGFRDWNTAVARLSNDPDFRIAVGDTVSGTYLKQPFIARVLAVREMSGGSHFEVALELEEAVDVVTFDGFSNFRRRVSGMVDDRGISPARTGDGEPQLAIQPLSTALA